MNLLRSRLPQSGIAQCAPRETRGQGRSGLRALAALRRVLNGPLCRPCNSHTAAGAWNGLASGAWRRFSTGVLQVWDQANASSAVRYLRPISVTVRGVGRKAAEEFTLVATDGHTRE